MSDDNGIWDVVEKCLADGLSFVPTKEDGSKRPSISWKSLQETQPSLEQAEGWYRRHRHTGIALICGTVSHNLEVFDFDDLNTFHAFRSAAQQTGLGDVLERIELGYSESTPSDGIHLPYFCTEVGRNTKLACRPSAVDQVGSPPVNVLIETRGEGGYIIIAPSHGNVHPNGGAYQLLQGDISTIATITPEERHELFSLARSFDELPRKEYQSRRREPGDEVDTLPGTAFNAKADWHDVLEPAGWTLVYQRGAVGYWRRPGKRIGVSATTNYGGSNLFICFSTSTPFETETGYSPWRVYAVLHHNADFKAAARELARHGYGTQVCQPTLSAPRREQLELLVIDNPISPRRSNTPQWPAPLSSEAFHGLAGEVVGAIAPETEADPVALLVDFLAATGNIIGSTPHWTVGGRRHSLRVWPVLVGETSKGRKGTARGAIKPILDRAAPEWMRNCTTSGLSTGEGLIWRVRDEIHKHEVVKDHGKTIGYEDVVVDPGVVDKRLFVTEEEFAAVIKVMSRDANTLSTTLRQAWDDGTLRTMSKNSPAVATGSHVTIVGHTTKEELLRNLSSTEAANGFANRFLWIAVRRSRLLPDGGSFPSDMIEDLATKLRAVIETATGIGLLARDDSARELWHSVYPQLSAGSSGLLGAITNRSEAQVMRIAGLYAVLDQVNVIGCEHLRAALAVWNYCEASCRYIFGDRMGNPEADAILSALHRSGEMSQTSISNLFGRNVSANRIQRALSVLLAAGKVKTETRDTGGRPVTVWRPC